MMVINDGGLAPGIYFSLSAERYHKDRAISRSDMVNLIDTPFTYWEKSWMNAERKRNDATDEQDYGEAFHTLLFEPAKFSSRYHIVAMDEWDQSKQMIAHDDYFKIVESIKVLRAGRDSKLFLSGGMPEVTIVFDFNGVRYRVRIDLLTPAIATVDFKTIFSLEEWHLKQAFKKYGYDIQIFLYKLAIIRFKQQLLLGEAHVYGHVDPAFLSKFMASKTLEFIFIFQRKTPPYPFELLMPEDDTELSGERRASDATIIFRENFERYGTARWPVCEGRAKTFSMIYGIKDSA